MTGWIFDPSETGYAIAYYQNEANHCPSCGRSHWHVGRMTAECAYCATALPIRTGRTYGVGLFRASAKPVEVPLAA